MDTPVTTGATIIPCLRYRDAPAMIAWLCPAFGFARHAMHAEGNAARHTRPVSGNGMITPGPVDDASERGGRIAEPGEMCGRETQCPCLIVADADAHHAVARSAGARIVQDIADRHDGGRGYSCHDPEGHLCWFGTYDPWTDQARG